MYLQGTHTHLFFGGIDTVWAEKVRFCIWGIRNIDVNATMFSHRLHFGVAHAFLFASALRAAAVVCVRARARVCSSICEGLYCG
jgi:hypothetical protein